LCSDGCGEGVRELADVLEEVVEDALGFLAAAAGGEFWRDGAEEVERAADLDEAVVQFVDGFGVFVGLVVVELLVVDVDLLAGVGELVGARWLVVRVGLDELRCRRREESVDSEVDRAVDDRACRVAACWRCRRSRAWCPPRAGSAPRRALAGRSPRGAGRWCRRARCGCGA
jgi:hypothetical protein